MSTSRMALWSGDRDRSLWSSVIEIILEVVKVRRKGLFWSLFISFRCNRLTLDPRVSIS